MALQGQPFQLLASEAAPSPYIFYLFLKPFSRLHASLHMHNLCLAGIDDFNLFFTTGLVVSVELRI